MNPVRAARVRGPVGPSDELLGGRYLDLHAKYTKP